VNPLRNRIKSAFDTIHAEDSLKAATLKRLYEKKQDSVQPRYHQKPRSWVVRAVCFVLILFSGMFSYNLYYTETAYIDIDINPSMAFTINCFERVIDVEAYNTEAEELISLLNLRHKKLDEAIDAVITASAQTGALQREGLVTVTVQAEDGNDTALMEIIETTVTQSASHNYSETQIDLFTVDCETRNAAHDHHVSPAKYLAILEWQAVEPTVTIDECRNHSIGEIRQMTQEHNTSHHGESGNHHGSGHE